MGSSNAYSRLLEQRFMYINSEADLYISCNRFNRSLKNYFWPGHRSNRLQTLNLLTISKHSLLASQYVTLSIPVPPHFFGRPTLTMIHQKKIYWNDRSPYVRFPKRQFIVTIIHRTAAYRNSNSWILQFICTNALRKDNSSNNSFGERQISQTVFLMNRANV